MQTDGRVVICREIMQKKTKEYTGDDADQPGAFKAAAALQQTTPQRALAEMLAKHIVSARSRNLSWSCFFSCAFRSLKCFSDRLAENVADNFPFGDLQKSAFGGAI